MFGEEQIVFAQKLKLDEKRRIRIPSSTKVIANEPIGILYSTKQDRLLLYSHEEYKKILNTFFQVLEKKKQSKEYDAKFLRSLQRSFFGRCCFEEEMTDINCRLLLPQKALETLEMQTSTFVVGKEKHLELFKDEESYKKSLLYRCK